MQYNNNLQLAELKIKNLNKRIKSIEEERDFIQEELNAIRRLDLGEHTEIIERMRLQN